MADEITFSLTLDVVNGEYKPGTYRITNLKVDQAAAGAADGIQAVGTTEEALALATGAITTGGLLVIRNLDATNYVEVGFATGVYPMKLLPQGIPLEVTTNGSPTIYLKANTAECDIWFRYLEA